MSVRVFSMFSGIGGFELGIQQSDINTELVGYAEIDKYAISIFKKQLKGVKNYGDATTIEPWRIPDFDLLVGGFPCQAFSVAGKQQGFNDTRGTLFFDIARVCAEKRPRYLVLENVKGLLSHDSGKTFQTILGVLADLGYRVEWQVLNSKDFGVPQNRERVFIVGHLGERSGQEIFPLTGTSKTFIRKIIDYEVRPVLTPDRAKKRQNGRRFKNDGEPSFTLTGQDVHGVMLRQLNKAESQGNRIYDSSGLATTLASQAGGLGAKTGLYQIDTQVRRLTPTECERLQGFPDGWTAGLSDTQRYKTLGNAVTVPVVTAVMNQLAQHI
jgi:DNA (cytosine-5)-methyltransferase 1|tara:strand:+ start:134 stop:1111 length:978 start_codon:yes stop_codon:yes gene_type:complete